MPETARSLIHRAAAAACIIVLSVVHAAAQQPDQPVVSPAPSAPEFLSRGDFHLAASALANSDIRFSWDTYWGGSVDVVDYVGGRAGVSADFEALLGDEFRIFDPNQGNYNLEAFASARYESSTEFAGIFHHVSRHLSDRPKRFAIAWNLLGARVLQRIAAGQTTVDLDIEGGKIVQHSFVDYSWIGELHIQVRRPINQRVGAYVRLMGQLVGVNGEVTSRDRQRGGFAEAGLRLNGRGGVMELFAGLERRVDADPIDRQPHQWAVAGFRLLSR